MTSLLSTLKVAAAILARPRGRDLTEADCAALDDIAVRTNASVAQLEAIVRRKELKALTPMQNLLGVEVAKELRHHQTNALLGRHTADLTDRVLSALPPLGHVVGHSTEAVS